MQRENARVRLETIAGTGRTPPGRLLDVGCAHGYFLDEARAAGWNVRGADVSPAAAQYASTRLGLDVATNPADAMDREGYDVVTLFQALEHVASPGELLQRARDALTAGGALVVETWDRGSPIAQLLGPRWQVVAPPSVMWLWDRATLGLLLESAGFTVTDIRCTRKRVSLHFVASLLGGGKAGPARARRVLERTRLREWSFTYGFGDLITVTATPAGRAADPEGAGLGRSGERVVT